MIMYVQNTLHTCANQSESIGKGSHLYLNNSGLLSSVFHDIIMTFFMCLLDIYNSMHRD